MATETNNNKTYRDKLVQQIKDAGRELIDRAETMVHPNLDLITDFSIAISFPQRGAEILIPEISFSTSVVNKTYYNRMCKKGG